MKVVLAIALSVSLFTGCTKKPDPELQDQVQRVEETPTVTENTTVDHRDIEVKFYKIPVNKQAEFYELYRARDAKYNELQKAGIAYDYKVLEENINFWAFIRTTVRNDLEVYRKGEYDYTWVYHMMNSNNVVVHNLYNFGFSEDEIRTLYGIYGSLN